METRQKQMSNFLQKEVNSKIVRKEHNLNQSLLEKGIGKSNGKGSAKKVPSGLLTSVGQEMVSDGFWAPEGAKAVRFTCGAGAAPTPGFTCKTKAMATFRIETKVGFIGTNTVIEVPIVTSNCAVEIFFQTTDSNGGYARWELIF